MALRICVKQHNIHTDNKPVYPSHCFEEPCTAQPGQVGARECTVECNINSRKHDRVNSLHFYIRHCVITTEITLYWKNLHGRDAGNETKDTEYPMISQQGGQKRPNKLHFWISLIFSSAHICYLTVIEGNMSRHSPEMEL